MTTKEDVAKLYVAMFNRAPDALGLDYWVNSSFGGNPTIEQIAQSFFDQQETKDKYPEGTTSEAFVASIYSNLFNRAPDAAGLSYWVQELNTGHISRSLMVEAIKNGALDSDISLDKTILDNKTEVGLYFADAGLSDASQANDVMSMISSDHATVEFINSKIDSGNISENVWSEYVNESGFVDALINNATFYSIIYDEMDNNKNGITDEYITIAIKYENGNRYLDFKTSDGVDDWSNASAYSISNGTLVVSEDGDTQNSNLIYDYGSKMLVSQSYNNDVAGAENIYMYDNLDDALLAEIGTNKEFNKEWLSNVETYYNVFQTYIHTWVYVENTITNGVIRHANTMTDAQIPDGWEDISKVYSIRADGSLLLSDDEYTYAVNATGDYLAYQGVATFEYFSWDRGYIFFDQDKAMQKYAQMKYGYIPFNDESGLGADFLKGKVFYSVNLNSLEGNTRSFTNTAMKTGDTLYDFNDTNGEAFSITSDGKMKLITEDGFTAYFELMDITDDYLLMHAYAEGNNQYYKFYFDKAQAVQELDELQNPSQYISASSGFTNEWLDGKVLFNVDAAHDDGNVYMLQYEDGFVTAYYAQSGDVVIENSNEVLFAYDPSISYTQFLDENIYYTMPYTIENGKIVTDETVLNGEYDFHQEQITSIQDSDILMNDNGATSYHMFTSYNDAKAYMDLFGA